MAAVERFDDLFFAVLQNCEQIEPFLDRVISFLARRTDFLHVMHKKTDKIGFPPGVAEKMLLKVFKKYQYIVQSETSVQSGNFKEKVKNKQTSSKVAQASNDSQLPDSRVSLTNMPDVPAPAISTVNVQTSNDNAEEQSMKETAAASENTERNCNTKVNKPSKVAECFNGAMLKNYMWSQTGSDIDIRVPVTCNIKGKDVLVEIKDTYLKVALKNIAGEQKVLVEGELQWKVHADESMWTLIPGEHVHVSLDKVEDRWWTCVIKGDEEIDKSKIDTTRDINEFDEQTQTDYQRVMFDHQQKMLGKPTIQEMKTHEMLKKAWNAPNSPFAGTPFDPSTVNISGNLS